jgi:PilZ domain
MRYNSSAEVVNLTICVKHTGGPLIERRRAKRFQVDWQIRVEIAGAGGSTLVETGALRNISSSGALLSLASPLTKGARLDVYIKLPLQRKKWMKYPARVVRIDSTDAAITAGIKFDSARPNFGMPLAPV